MVSVMPLFAAPPPPPPASPRHLFIFGVGYVGLPLAQSLQHSGWTVAGLTFSSSRAQMLSNLGIPTVHSQHNDIEAASFVEKNLQSATHVIGSAPPDEKGDPVIRDYGHMLAASAVAWMGYLSSTSVYGGHDGAWVDETSVSPRVSELGRRRLVAESEWTTIASRCSAALDIFRLAGIYGMERNPMQTLRKNPNVIQSTAATSEMFASRIHVDDIVKAIMAAVVRYDGMPNGGGEQRHVFNVADDLPTSRREVFEFAAQLLDAAGVRERGSEQPIQQEARARPSGRDQVRSNKKVSNAKMKRLLLPQLSFPTYREGLQAIARGSL